MNCLRQAYGPRCRICSGEAWRADRATRPHDCFERAVQLWLTEFEAQVSDGEALSIGQPPDLEGLRVASWAGGHRPMPFATPGNGERRLS
jgi:hypothetical protein